jgi:EpsI family protein
MSVLIRNFVLLALMLVAASLAAALRPTISMADERPPIDLKSMVPTAFDDWRQLERSGAYIIDPQTQQLLDTIYSETLSRTYVNSKGYQIMLSIAYGKNQSDALQLHKPEVCYPAQGFQLFDKHADMLDLGDRSIPTTRLMTKLGQRQEPVTYWTVVGDHVTVSGIDKKLTELRYAINDRIPDGMLIRVSSIDGAVDNAYQNQDRFARAMVTAIASVDRERFSGAGHVGNAPSNKP